MKNVIIISLMLLSCSSGEHSVTCDKGERSYHYVNDKTEPVIYYVDFHTMKAKVYENRNLPDDQGFGYLNIDLDISDSYFKLGDVLVPKFANGYAVDKWKFRGTSCTLVKKFASGFSASCKSNPHAGYVIYHFDFDRGITQIEEYLADGAVIVQKLTSAEGLGRKHHAINCH